MKTCITTYSYKKALDKGDFTHFDAIDHAKAQGLDAIELALQPEIDKIPEGYTFLGYVKALAAHAKEIGLEVAILTISRCFYKDNDDEMLALLKSCVDAASEAGIPMMRHDIVYAYKGTEAVKSPAVLIEAVAPYIRELAEYAESKGVMTCSENHGRIMQDPERLEALFNAVNHRNYKLLFDMSNFGGADVDTVQALSKLRDHICHVHAKDTFRKSGMLYNPGRGYSLTRGGDYRRATIFGHGDIPTFQTLAALKNFGYDGYVSIEFEGMEDCLPALEISMENLKRMIGDLTR